MYQYPVYSPQLGEEEKRNVLDCLETNWISSKGKYVELFEKNFSIFTDIAHSNAVANGTVAIHLALAAIGIGPGDEVIVPSFTYVASVNGIRYVGATPVFADCSRADWQMGVEEVRRCITPKTKAVMAVHLYGSCTDMAALAKFCKEKNLLLIEDCAEAFGTYDHGRHAGGFGDISTFSFYGNKTITTGEGGMVCTQSESIDSVLRHLKNQGVSKTKQYWHDVVGFNFRMTNICAAIGVAQLDRAQQIIQVKKEINQMYEERLRHKLEFLPCGKGIESAHWMVTALAQSEEKRNALRAFLDSKKIETRPSFYPVHLMPMYEQKLDLPVTMDIAFRGINLPSSPTLTENDVNVICNAVIEFYG
jgi:perosamine synthetase